MNSSEGDLGIDLGDPETLRAIALAEGDHRFLRKLVAIRKQAGLSQQEVADRLGVTQPTVAAFERYDNDPKLSTIRRYAQVVGALVVHHVEVDSSDVEAPGSGEDGHRRPGAGPRCAEAS